MLIAGFMVAGFSVAAVYAWAWLRGRRDRYHRIGAGGAAHDRGARGARAARRRRLGGPRGRRLRSPRSSRRSRGSRETTKGAPIHVLGWYDGRRGEVRDRDPADAVAPERARPDATVEGLDAVPPDERPPVNVVRVTFQTMVAIGTGLALLAAVYLDHVVAPAAPAALEVVLPGRGRWPGRRRVVALIVRLDHDRGGAPAVDRLPGDAGGGGRDRRVGDPARLRDGGRRVRGAHRHRVVLLRRLARTPLRPRGDGRRDAPGRRRRMSLADWCGALIVLGLTAYAVLGGADFGTGVWDVTAGDDAWGRRDPLQHRALDGAGVGGQPRLADLRARRVLDGVPGRRSGRSPPRSTSRCSWRPSGSSCAAPPSPRAASTAGAGPASAATGGSSRCRRC